MRATGVFLARMRAAAGSALGSLLLVALFAFGTPVLANDRHAAFVVDANTGDVLRNEEADEPRVPASLTKMMTLYLTFEAIEAGRLSYGTRITVSQEAASQAPTKLDLDPGETINVIDAVKALITKSANDMAVALGEHLGGTHAHFAELMTAKARQLGMTHTTFRNANGLPIDGQYTSARDMVTLALHLHDDFPRHYPLFAIKSFSYGRNTFRNHNNLLFNFQGTEGIKTGYTRASGFNLVASVKRGTRHVVGAIFGGSSAAGRDDAMRLMLSHALMRASPVKTRRPLSPAAPVLVAQARPVQRPAPAPAPVPASRAAPAVAAPAVIAQAAPAPQPVSQPPSQPVSPPAPSVRIDVARVKPVMVPLRTRRPEAETAVAMASPPSTAVQSTSVNTTAPQPPAVAGSQFHFAPEAEPFPASAPVAPRAVAAPLPASPVSRAPASAPPAPPARGLPPSTLGRQAASLNQARPATIPPAAALPGSQSAQPVAQPLAVRAPVATPASAAPFEKPRYSLAGPSPSASGFEVQVGAFGTSVEAEKALATVNATAADVLTGHPGRSVQVQKENRQLFRARLTNFDSRSAAAACLELRRRQIDCFVMKVE